MTGRYVVGGLMVCLLTACSTGARGDVSKTKPSSTTHVSRSAAHPTFVKVPPIRSYVSVERAQRKLAQAGLVGVAPKVQFPHYFVMTKPKAGTKVELGSEVRLIIGDG